MSKSFSDFKKGMKVKSDTRIYSPKTDVDISAGELGKVQELYNKDGIKSIIVRFPDKRGKERVIGCNPSQIRIIRNIKRK